MQNTSGFREWIDPTRIYDPRRPAGRLTYLWGVAIYPFLVLLVLLTPVIIFMESGPQAANNSDNLGIVIYLFMMVWLTAAVCIIYRRLRDLQMSPRWVWMIILPFGNLLFLLYLLLKSAPGASRPPA